MTVEEQARLALAAKGTAEANLARIAHCPPWRHAAFAATMAVIVASPAVALPLRFALLALVFGAIIAIVQSDKRRLGVFINGYRRGKTRWVTFPMLALVLTLYAASFYFATDRGQPEISLALGVATFGIGYLCSVLWQKVFVRELGA